MSCSTPPVLTGHRSATDDHSLPTIRTQNTFHLAGLFSTRRRQQPVITDSRSQPATTVDRALANEQGYAVIAVDYGSVYHKVTFYRYGEGKDLDYVDIMTAIQSVRGWPGDATANIAKGHPYVFNSLPSKIESEEPSSVAGKPRTDLGCLLPILPCAR